MDFRYIHAMFLNYNSNNSQFHTMFIKLLLVQAIHLRILFYNFNFRTVRKILYELARDSEEFTNLPIEELKTLVIFCMQLSLDYITEEELEQMIDDEVSACEEMLINLSKIGSGEY